jgi:hypothetical protein
LPRYCSLVLAHQGEILNRLAKAKAKVPAALAPPGPAIGKA